MDRMDDIWKDRFNSEDLPQGEWNTPDDMVWENIADNTVRKKGKRRAALWIWTMTGLLVLILGGLFLNSNTSLSNSEDTNKDESTGQLMESSQNDDSAFKSAASVSQKYTVPNTNKVATSTDEDNLNNDGVISLNNVSNDKDDNSKVTNTSKQKQITSVAKEQTYARVAPRTKTPSNTANEFAPTQQKAIPTNLTTTTSETKEQIDVSKNGVSIETPTTEENTSPLIAINTVATNLLTTKASIKEIQLNLNDSLNVPKKLFPIHFTVSVGASYWKHVISNNYRDDLSAADFNYTDEFGYLVDFDASVPLGKRFALSAGVAYEQINISSGHNGVLSYDPAAEGTDASNAYTASLATPYGISNADFRFERSQDIGNDPVDLMVDFHSGHTIRNFAIPLSLEYYPLGKTRTITPILRTGFGVNYLSGISNNIQSIDTHHDAIQFDDSGSSSFMAPDIKKWHYDYRLGLGARIQWRSDFAIVLNYERMGGINAIFQQDTYNTRINRQHLSIGLSKVLLR